jgi:hypothetical protein
MRAFSLTALVALLPLVASHALITSPPVRVPGPKHLEVCGKPSYDRLLLDPSGHIEEQLPIASSDCELTLCRGMLFEDQATTNIQRVTPGQQMTLGVDCTIPHGGPANVTLLDTTGGGPGRIIGGFLKTFADFCPTSGGTPADQSNLQFTLPQDDDIADACREDGQCVVQLFWATPDLSQNYYYCVDVTVGLASPGTGASTTGGPNTASSTGAGPNTSASVSRSTSADAAGATRPPDDGSLGRYASTSGSVMVGLGAFLLLLAL